MFTSHLIKTLGVLQAERSELFRVIRAKDIELGEFKNSGLKVTRPHLRTEWFEPEDFLSRPLPDLNENSRTELQFLVDTQAISLLNKVGGMKRPEDEVDNNQTAAHTDAQDNQIDSSSPEKPKFSSPGKPELSEELQRKRKADSPSNEAIEPAECMEPAPPSRPIIKVKTKKTALQKKLMKL